MRKEVVLARLCLGHTRVTHSYLLQGEEQPQCVGCDASFTEHHFLLECGDFAQVRNNCFHAGNMKQLIQDIHIDSIMKEINLFEQNLIAIFFFKKNVFCFIFVLAYSALYIVSLQHYDLLSLYSVQSKNMYSRLDLAL